MAQRVFRAFALLVCFAASGAAQLTITSQQHLPNAEVNVPYTFTFQADGGTAPYTWAIYGTLQPPAGFTLGATTGVLQFTATRQAPIGFVIQVTDAHGDTAQQQPIGDIYPPPQMNNTLPWATQGAQYSVADQVQSGLPPYQISVAGLPPGMGFTYTSPNVNFTGAPTTAGDYSISVTITDGVGGVVVVPIPLTVRPPIAFSTAASLPPGTVGVWYLQTIMTTGGTAPTITLQSGSTLPSNFSIGPWGLLGGTPTAAGTYHFTLVATDRWGSTASQAYTMVVTAVPAILGLPQSAASVGTPFSLTLQAVNVSQPAVWSISAGNFPPGLTLNQSGQITSLPTAAGNFNFTVLITDSTGATGSAVFTIIVAQSPLQIGATLPDATTGQPYSQKLTISGGIPPYVFRESRFGAGLDFEPTTFQFSGSPAHSGTFSGTISVNDSVGTIVTQLVTIVIHSGVVITNSSSLPDASVGLMYSQTLVASNAVPFLNWSVQSGSLPPGLTLGAMSGVLGGIPTASGNFTFQVQLIDSYQNPAQKTFTVAVAGNSFSITTAKLPIAFGPGYAQALSASGGKPPYTWSIASGSLPTGFALDPSTGVLTETAISPPVGTITPIVVQVTDALGAIAQKSYSLYFTSPLKLNPPLEPFNPEDDVFQAPSGGFGPYTYVVVQGTMPPGVTLVPLGAFVGHPKAPGSYPIVVQVTDSLGEQATAPEYLYIPGGGSLSLSGGALPAAQVGQQYLATLHANGGAAPYTYSILSGALPGGLELDSSSGWITGTPTQITLGNVSIKVIDGKGANATAAFTLQTLDSLGIDTGSPLSPGKVGTAYSLTFSTGGGIKPYHFAVSSGLLPPGLQLNPSKGMVSGSPTAAGTYAFTITLSDSVGGAASFPFTLAVSGGIAISPSPPLPPGVVGTAYAVQFSAQGLPPYVWQEAGSAPPGIAFNPATARLSGTPNQTGTFSFTISVTDSANAKALVACAITVTAAGTLAITSQNALPAARVSNMYSSQIVAAGGKPPYHWSPDSGTLPEGLSLDSSTGQVGGTPALVGQSAFDVTATDGAGGKSTARFNLVVGPAFSISTTGPPSAGIVATAYHLPLRVYGGQAPLQWSLAAGTLPNGLQLDTASGSIAGVPANPSIYSVTIKATDSTDAIAMLPLVIEIATPALAIATRTSTLSASIGSPYQFSFTATAGTPPYHWSISAGSLPTGLTMSPADASITGKPTVAGNFPLTILVTDSAGAVASVEETLTVINSGPYISTQGVLNAGSYEGAAVTPGEVVVLFGHGLGPQSLANMTLDSSGKVSTTLQGTQVFFDNFPAPLIYTQDQSICVVVPYEIAGQQATQIHVEYQGKSSPSVSLPVTTTLPGIFTIGDTGAGQAAALNADGAQNSPDHPAEQGSIITVFATGGGQTSPGGVDGAIAASPLPLLESPVEAEINNSLAQVISARPASGSVAGVLQITIRIPVNAPGGPAVPLRIQIGNAFSQAGVTLAIREGTPQ